MTSIFFDGDTIIFASNFEFAPKFFCFFFNRKSIFLRKQTFSKKVFLPAKFNFLSYNHNQNFQKLKSEIKNQFFG